MVGERFKYDENTTIYNEVIHMVKGYSKGKIIHRTKKSADKIAANCRNVGVKYRIVRLAKGYRVDKQF